MKKPLLFIGVLILFMQSGFHVHASTSIPRERFTVTPGVDYQDFRFVMNSLTQSSRVMQIDVSNPNIIVEPSILNPINKLGTTSARAKMNTYERHHVVGAINGSFFHTSSKMPAYLVAQNNQVSTLGVISTGKDEYMNVPSAFGITQSGAAQIDVFGYDSYVEINGMRNQISSINKDRGVNETIVYTPSWSYKETRTNEYGMEIVVEGSAPIENSLEFGKPITGVVTQIIKNGRGGMIIPKNGYVLSVQGGAEGAKYADVAPGQAVNLVINVDNRWKNAKSMIASGPMIVKNGKVDLTIDKNSSRAKERAPRTAVATDQTGKKVYFVTVDGRQSGYSRGMTIPEFAQYLVSIGVSNAINLDGGGSTTMVARKPGDIYATVMNRYSDKYERSVSTVLQAVNIAPYGEPVRFEFKKSTDSAIQIGTSITVDNPYALDQNHTRLPINTNLIQYSVEGNIGKMQGNTFTATNTGSGYIVGIYKNAVKKVPITVYENQKYSDVSSTHWAYKEINYLADKKIINGYSNGKFLPEGKLTRAHAAALLIRALNLPIDSVGNRGFTDVPTTHLYYKEIATVANSGLMTGKNNNTSFDPDGTLSRAQMAAILARAYSLQGVPGEKYMDVPVDHWAYKEIHALTANNIATFPATKIFKPNDSVTRSQFSAFLYRIFTK